MFAYAGFNNPSCLSREPKRSNRHCEKGLGKLLLTVVSEDGGWFLVDRNGCACSFILDFRLPRCIMKINALWLVI